MKKSKLIILLLILSISNLIAQNNIDANEEVAGFRASRILQSYPNNQFPSPDYWVDAGNFISSKFNNNIPASIWIVSLYIGSGDTQLSFPSPGGSFPHINFIGTDRNEEYLDQFDTQGFKIWLQVEPGAADIATLAQLVLNRYKHHPSVVGFGVDVEWYNTHLYSGGQKLNDSTAHAWEQVVKSIDSTYTLFVKHYSQTWMPPVYRGDLIFVDDSQGFQGYSNPFNAMINEFKAWGSKFFPNKVWFQYGYPNDKVWWSQLNDPMKTIGDALRSNIPNCYGLFWVDFTINDIYPVTNIETENLVKPKFNLYQNYPNPFNPNTVIEYYIPESRQIKIVVYDITGNELKVLIDDFVQSGNHKTEFNAESINFHISSGVYFYRLSSGKYSDTKKFVLLK